MILLGLTLLPLALAGAQPASDAEAFRLEMIGRLRIAHPKLKFEIGKEPLVVTYGEDASINLHRVFGYCQSATAEDCATEKQNLVSKITLETPAPTKDSLRVIVRDQVYVDYLDELRRRSSDKAPTGTYRKIGEDLYALIASDAPDTIAMVGDRHLKEMGLSAEQAWAVAEQNMRPILPALPDAAQLRKSAIAFQDLPYTSAVVADLPHWTRVSKALGDELFMTIVSEHFVFVGLMPDSGVSGFRSTVAEDCDSQPRCISPNIYRFRDGHWVVAR